MSANFMNSLRTAYRAKVQSILSNIKREMSFELNIRLYVRLVYGFLESICRLPLLEEQVNHITRE